MRLLAVIETPSKTSETFTCFVPNETHNSETVEWQGFWGLLMSPLGDAIFLVKISELENLDF